MVSLVALAAGLTAAAAPDTHAARFDIDERRSEVRFTYTMALATQRGRFTKISGTLDYDESAPEKSRIQASIATASLTTGEDLIERELKGPDFFNAKASPVIGFRSLSVRPRTADTAEVLGEITLNGITRRVMLNVKLEPYDTTALKFAGDLKVFTATTRIQRSDFNMTAYRALVEDAVDLEIVAIVRPKKLR